MMNWISNDCNSYFQDQTNRCSFTRKNIQSLQLPLSFKTFVRSEETTFCQQTRKVQIYCHMYQRSAYALSICNGNWEASPGFFELFHLPAFFVHGYWASLIPGFLDPCSAGCSTPSALPLHKVASVTDRRTELGTIVYRNKICTTM